MRALTTDRFSRPDDATIGSMTELLTLLPSAIGAGWDACPAASSACAARTAPMASGSVTRPARSSAERMRVTVGLQ